MGIEEKGAKNFSNSWQVMGNFHNKWFLICKVVLTPCFEKEGGK